MRIFLFSCLLQTKLLENVILQGKYFLIDIIIDVTLLKKNKRCGISSIETRDFEFEKLKIPKKTDIFTHFSSFFQKKTSRVIGGHLPKHNNLQEKSSEDLFWKFSFLESLLPKDRTF